MATGGSGDVTLIAHYCGKKLSLTIPVKAKVGDIVQKAAETLHLKKEDLPLSLIYQGTPVDDGTPVEVSCAAQVVVGGIRYYNNSRKHLDRLSQNNLTPHYCILQVLFLYTCV